MKYSAAFLNLKKIALFAFAASPITWILQKLNNWHLDNSDYVTFVVGAIVVDHLLGSLYHAFWLKDFSVKKNASGLLIKLIIVVSVGYLFEGLDTLMERAEVLKEYTIMVLRLMVFLYPASSAFQNAYMMTNKKFPPMSFMERINHFTKNASENSENK